MGKDNDFDGGHRSNRYLKKERVFGGDKGRGQNKGKENLANAAVKRIENSEEALRSSKLMLDIFLKDSTDNLKGVSGYFKWLDEAFKAMEYKVGVNEVSKMDEGDWKALGELLVGGDGDISVEYALSSGAGGQNVQKNETAAHVTHNLTHLFTDCEDERSKEQNKQRAVEQLGKDLAVHVKDIVSVLGAKELLQNIDNKVLISEYEKKRRIRERTVEMFNKAIEKVVGQTKRTKMDRLTRILSDFAM